MTYLSHTKRISGRDGNFESKKGRLQPSNGVWIVEVEVPWADGVLHFELDREILLKETVADVKRIVYENYAEKYLEEHFRRRNTQLEYRGYPLSHEDQVVCQAMDKVHSDIGLPQVLHTHAQDLHIDYFRLAPKAFLERALGKGRIGLEFLVKVPWCDGDLRVVMSSGDTLEGLKRKVYSQFRFLPLELLPHRMIFKREGRAMLDMTKTFEELQVATREHFDLVPGGTPDIQEHES